MFDAKKHVLLVALKGEAAHRLNDGPSLYSEGTFFVMLGKSALTEGKLDDALVLYEGGS